MNKSSFRLYNIYNKENYTNKYYCTGDNTCKLLKDTEETEIIGLQEFETDKKIKKAYGLSGNIIVYITSDNELYVRCSNDMNDVRITNIPEIQNIKKIDSTDTCIYLLSSNGYLYEIDIDNIVESEATSTFILSSDDSENIIDFACGIDHLLILSSLGNVYSYGNSDYGQTGLGYINNVEYLTKIESLSNIVKIAAGDKFSLFLDDSNKLYGCGLNDNNQISDSEITSILSPVQCPINSAIIIDKIYCAETSSFVIDINNVLYILGSNDLFNANVSSFTRISNIYNAMSLDIGIGNMMIMTKTGKLLALGNNTKHMLPSNDTVVNLNSELFTEDLIGCICDFDSNSVSDYSIVKTTSSLNIELV